MTGIRPREAARRRSRRSSRSPVRARPAVRVGASPVVPHGTRPSMPARTCHRTSRRNASSSSDAVGGERRDEGGEGAAERGRVAGWCGRGGASEAPFGSWSGLGHGRERSGGRPGGVGSCDRGVRAGEQRRRRPRRTRGCPATAARPQPVDRRQRAGGIGGSIARRQPELDRLAGSIESHRVHARASSLPGRRRPRLSALGIPGCPAIDAPDQLPGGPGRAVGLGRADATRRWPARSRRGDSATASSTRRRNRAAPEAEVRRGDGRAPRRAPSSLDGSRGPRPSRSSR